MKMKKFLSIILVLLFVMTAAFAENSHSYNLVTDFAYYPQSNMKFGLADTHFAPLSGIYRTIEFRMTGNYFYTIPVPFSDNPLVKGNNVKLGAALELTPISAMPIFTAQFTPIAFLVFTAGAKFGTGWDFTLMNAQGNGVYNDFSKSFDSAKPFADWFSSYWFEGLFQFDVGAIVPGDWTHVVMQASYRLFYLHNTAAENGEIWKWQSTADYANGWKYYSQLLLGYQMPLVLQTVALQCELEGYFDGGVYHSRYAAWNPGFMQVNLSPVAILKFSDNHQLTIQCRFRSRRSFTTPYLGDETDYDKIYAGREWYFDRVAFSYLYKF